MVNSILPDFTASSLEADELEELLTYLKQVLQIDLTGYKRPSLLRRTLIRMQRAGAKHYQDYFNLLQQQPDEVTHLLNTIFINCTFFFRDRPVWDYLEHQLIPQIIAHKAPREPIRIWSAGCASGEETYSLAMLLAEALGLEQFQRRVKICGTDVDQDAILQAQRGYYPTHTAEMIPAYLLERYFELTTQGYRCRPELCRSIRFRSHNLLYSPPLPQIDLLVCRNTLMYFTLEAQLRVLAGFHSSLQQQGFLLLGKAEHLVHRLQTSLFTPAHQQVRSFTKVPEVYWRCC